MHRHIFNTSKIKIIFQLRKSCNTSSAQIFICETNGFVNENS